MLAKIEDLSATGFLKFCFSPEKGYNFLHRLIFIEGIVS